MVFCLMARWTFVDFDLDAIVFSPEKYTQNLWESFHFRIRMTTHHSVPILEESCLRSCNRGDLRGWSDLSAVWKRRHSSHPHEGLGHRTELFLEIQSWNLHSGTLNFW